MHHLLPRRIALVSLLVLACTLTLGTALTSCGGGGGSNGALAANGTLAVTADATPVAAGAVLAPVTLQLRESGGGAWTGGEVSVTVSLNGGAAGAALSGTTSKTTTGGGVSFDDLSIDLAGDDYRLAFEAQGFNNSLSATFYAHGSFDRIEALSAAATVADDGTLSVAPSVEVVDSGGRRLTTATSIRLSVASGPENLELGGTLARDSVNGVVTFDDVTASHQARFTLQTELATGGNAVSLPATTASIPNEVSMLAPGLAIEHLLTTAGAVSKIAETPDGRIFYTDLGSGDVHLLASDFTSLASPWANVSVATGGERGLIGLALSPDFATTGHVFLQLTHQDSAQRVVRFTDTNNASSGQTTIVDDLPAAVIHNGGELVFLDDGTLIVSIGDANDANSAQRDGDLSGRLLRYNADGSIPVDNPDPTSPEWCRGLRNTFALAEHPNVDALIGADNGPTSDDRLHFMQAGKNFIWPSQPQNVPGQDVGILIRNWPTVIAPTGLAWHNGAGFAPEWDNNLLITAYDDGTIFRFTMSGSLFSNIDDEFIIARMDELQDFQHKPLSICRLLNGDILIGTFNGIWRITHP